MSSSVNAVELSPVDVLVRSVVNGMSKSNCQLVPVVKSGQENTLESGTLLMFVGGCGGKLWVPSRSISTLEVAPLGKICIVF